MKSSCRGDRARRTCLLLGLLILSLFSLFQAFLPADSSLLFGRENYSSFVSGTEKPAPSALRFQKDSYSADVGKWTKMIFVYEGAEKKEELDLSVTCRSSNDSVADVMWVQYGEVYVLGKRSGSVEVFVQSCKNKEIKASATVLVADRGTKEAEGATAPTKPYPCFSTASSLIYSSKVQIVLGDNLKINLICKDKSGSFLLIKPIFLSKNSDLSIDEFGNIDSRGGSIGKTYKVEITLEDKRFPDFGSLGCEITLLSPPGYSGYVVRKTVGYCFVFVFSFLMVGALWGTLINYGLFSKKSPFFRSLLLYLPPLVFSLAVLVVQQFLLGRPSPLVCFFLSPVYACLASFLAFTPHRQRVCAKITALLERGTHGDDCCD